MAQPYRCPVCGGRGLVQGGFYNNATGSTAVPVDEICRSCEGNGIVWEPSAAHLTPMVLDNAGIAPGVTLTNEAIQRLWQDVNGDGK